MTASREAATVTRVVGEVLRRVDEELVEEAEEVMQIDHHQMSETWNKALSLALHSSPAKQFGISFGIGWLSGYLFKRVSKTAAFLLGCSFLAVQGAATLGIIKINWRRVSAVLQQRLSTVQGLGQNHNSPITVKIVRFCQQHLYITSGFTAGAVVAVTF